MQLHVRLLQAKDIAKMDTFGKTDAYCLLALNGSSPVKSKVIKNNMTPVWNEEFHFNVSSPQGDILKIKMRDEDVVCDDDMATLDLYLSSLPVGMVVDNWYAMMPCRKVKKGGLLHLLLHLCPPGGRAFLSNPLIPVPQTRSTLHLRIVEARDIPKMDTIGKTDAYCIISISEKNPQKTRVENNTMTPRWNEDFHFDVTNPQSDEIHLLMRDKDVIKDDDIGTWGMPLRYVPFNQVCDQWVTLKARPKVANPGRLHIVTHFAPVGAPAFVASPLPSAQNAASGATAAGVNAAPAVSMATIQTPQPPRVQQGFQPMPSGYISPPAAPAPQTFATGAMAGAAPPPSFGSGYGQPAYGSGYGAPPVSGYAAPPPVSGYGAPPVSGYGAPPVSGYGAPPAAAGYGAPPPQYGAPPPQSGYGAPPPQYGAPPPQSGYGVPPQSGYGAPYGSGYPQPGYGGYY